MRRITKKTMAAITRSKMNRLKKREREREVEQIHEASAAVFEEVERRVNSDPELLIYYRGNQPYALALERQSMGIAVAGDPSKTGHEGRVFECVGLARQHDL